MSNHALVRLISFASRFKVHLCNTQCRRFTKILYFEFFDLNRARIETGKQQHVPNSKSSYKSTTHLPALHAPVQKQREIGGNKKTTGCQVSHEAPAPAAWRSRRRPRIPKLKWSLAPAPRTQAFQIFFKISHHIEFLNTYIKY